MDTKDCCSVSECELYCGIHGVDNFGHSCVLGRSVCGGKSVFECNFLTAETGYRCSFVADGTLKKKGANSFNLLDLSQHGSI